MVENWQKIEGGKRLLYIKVSPNASREKVVGEVVDTDGKVWLSVRVTQPAEGGKANGALIKMLAKELGVAQKSLTIIKGETSRFKVVLVCS